MLQIKSAGQGHSDKGSRVSQRRASNARGQRRDGMLVCVASRTALGATLAVLLLTAEISRAANTWTGTTDQDWNTAANWGGAFPTTGAITINTATGNFPVYDEATILFSTYSDIIVGSGAAGRLDQTAGTLATGNGNYMIVGRNASGVGTYNLTGTGSLNVGGTSTTVGRLILGDAGNSTGTVTMNTSGTLKLEDDAIGLLMGSAGTSVGNFNLNGGTLQVNSVNSTGIAMLAGTNGGDSTFTMTAGTVNATGGVWAGDNSAGSQGAYAISGGNFNVTSTGTFSGTQAGAVYIGRGLGQGTFTVSGTAAVTFTNANGSNIGFSNTATAGTTGLLTVSGGTFTNTGDLRVGVGQSGNAVIARAAGTFNVSGGTANIGGTLQFARGNDAGDLVTGSSTISGGTLNVAGDLVLAFAGNGNIGQMTISAGTVNAGTAAERWFMVNQYDSARGQLTVSGGTLNLNTNTDLRFSAGGGVGASFVTLSSGAITSYSGNGTGSSTSGVVDLNQAGGATANNTFNLDGGTLTISQVMTNNNNGTAVFNFNGGTLKASNTNANFVDLGGALQTAVVKSGGALIDSNGFNVTIPQALIAGSPSGGLTKSGAGALSLTGTNTYTGATTVNAGTLTLSGAGAINSASGITIDGSGAKFLQTSSVASTPAITLTQGTLDGTTTVGAVTVGLAGTAASKVVANGNGTTTALNLGSLTFNGTGTMSLRMAGGATTTSPSLVTTGTLTLSGGAGSVAVNITPTAALVNGSTYQLISYGGAFTGDAANDFILTGGISGRQSGVFASTAPSAGFITLAISGDTPVWTGVNGSAWVEYAVSTPTTGTPNFALTTGQTATDFWTGDVAEFNDTYDLSPGPGGTTGVTQTTVDIAAGAANPNGVGATAITFNNSAVDYTITSTTGKGITSGLVTKNGSGKVTINTANSYAGGTTINAGTIAVNNATSLGAESGALTLNNGTLQTTADIATTRNITLGHANSTLLVDAATTFTVSTGILSGAGALNKTGAGTLVLGGANTYAGGTTISAGTLQITTTSGSANTGTFNLGGGTFQVNLGAGTNFGYAPTINLTAASTIGNAAAGSLANLNGQVNYTGTINGGGFALNVANTGLARLYMNGTLSNVSQLNVQSGAMGFDLNSTNSRGAMPVAVANGAALWFAGANANPISNPLTFNGGTGINSAGALYYEGGSATPAAITSTITLASGNTSVGGSSAADTVTLSGQITGPGALTKVTGNAYVLSGANDFSGGATVAAGVLRAANNAALGTNAASISAVAGAQLQLAAGVDVGNALTINGGGAVSQGALYVPTGDATYSGPINITGLTQAGGHFASGTGTLTVSGAITSSSPVTVRIGTVVLSNTGSSYNALAIQQGTVKLGATNAIPATASVALGASGAATLDLAGYNQTVTGVTKGANGATVTNSAPATTSTLTTTGTSTYAGVINDGAGAATVAVNVASGSLTLTSANNYSGGTIINSGIVYANNTTGSATGTGAVTVNSGGTLGGNGFVAGAVVVNGTGVLSPGNSIDSLDVGNLSFNAEGATFAAEIDLAGAMAADLMNVTGALSFFAGGSTLNLTLTNYPDPLGGPLTFILAQNDGADAITGSIGTITGLPAGYLASLSYTFSGSDALSRIGDGNDFAVTLTAVPEASAFLYGSLIVSSIGAWNWRQRRRLADARG